MVFFHDMKSLKFINTKEPNEILATATKQHMEESSDGRSDYNWSKGGRQEILKRLVDKKDEEKGS